MYEDDIRIFRARNNFFAFLMSELNFTSGNGRQGLSAKAKWLPLNYPLVLITGEVTQING